jgi:hypothetical protein
MRGKKNPALAASLLVQDFFFTTCAGFLHVPKFAHTGMLNSGIIILRHTEL